MRVSSTKIAIRPMDADNDLGPVLDVMRAALGETDILRRTSELFRWKHLDNPFGRSILFVATHGDRIVGLRAFMRWELTTPDGSTVRCVRPVDTATHPDYQRLGIFQRLTEHAVDAAKNDGVDLIFNTPNPKSRAGYEKMGWSIAGSFGVMIRPSWRAAGRRFQSAVRLPTGPPGFEHRMRTPRGLQTPRTPSFVAWRLSHPTAGYGIVEDRAGYVLARNNHRGGRLETVISMVAGEADGALTHLLRMSRSAYAVSWFPPSTPERRLMLRRGIVHVPGVKSLTLACKPLRSLPVDPADLANWDVALADLELL